MFRMVSFQSPCVCATIKGEYDHLVQRELTSAFQFCWCFGLYDKTTINIIVVHLSIRILSSPFNYRYKHEQGHLGLRHNNIDEAIA